MRILSVRVHGYIDYALVGILLLAPALLSFRPLAATICYAVATGQLVLSLLTDYPLGAAKLVPPPVHGVFELVMGAGLLSAAWLFRASEIGEAQWFFVVIGALVLLLWALTRYAAGIPARAGYDRYDR